MYKSIQMNPVTPLGFAQVTWLREGCRSEQPSLPEGSVGAAVYSDCAAATCVIDGVQRVTSPGPMSTKELTSARTVSLEGVSVGGRALLVRSRVAMQVGEDVAGVAMTTVPTIRTYAIVFGHSATHSTGSE